MEDLLRVYYSSLQKTAKISELSDTIIDIAKSAFESIAKTNPPNPAGTAIKNQIDVFSRLKTSGSLKDILPIVYGQQVVLLVSSLEVLLRDLVRYVGQNHINMISWPEKSTGKIDLSALSNSNLTIGDIILGLVEQQGISFQDVQSMNRFFAEYLGISLEIEKQYEENLILATALRHAFVHNGGIINVQTARQIRNLDKNIRTQFAEGTQIDLTDQQITEFRDTFILYGDSIKQALDDKLQNSIDGFES